MKPGPGTGASRPLRKKTSGRKNKYRPGNKNSAFGAWFVQNSGIMTVSSTSVFRGRLPWVETARLLATLSVIMQHVPSGGFPPNQWLIGPALATFFLLAGYFSASRLQGEGAGKWTAGRVMSLLRPYLFWCAAYWLLAGMPVSPGALASVFGLGVCPLLTPMWFLRDLMVFTLAAFLLSKIRWVLYAAGLFCLFLNRWDDSLAWPSPYMFGDFVLGIMLASSIPGCLDRWEKLPLAVHGSILLACTALVWTSCTDTFLIPDTAFSGLAVLAFLSFGMVARAISPALAERLALWSSGSFFVYCSHIFVLIALTGVEACFPSPWPAWAWWCLVPVVYMLARGVYLFIKRYFPRALVLMTGGK